MSTTEVSESNYCNKNLYCSGKCLALLSALMVIAVCHDSKCSSVSNICPVNDFAIGKVDCVVVIPRVFSYVRARTLQILVTIITFGYLVVIPRVFISCFGRYFVVVIPRVFSYVRARTIQILVTISTFGYFCS